MTADVGPLLLSRNQEHRKPRMSATVCPYCRVVIDESHESPHACPACGTPHHADCFQENGGCTVFGCTAAPADEPKLSIGTLEVITVAGAPVPSAARTLPPPPLVANAPRPATVTVTPGADNDHPNPGAFTELANRLNTSRYWVAAQFGWVLVWIWTFFYFQQIERLPQWLSALSVSHRVLVLIAALAVQAGMLRSLIRNDGKRVRPFWGAVALLLWVFLCLITAEMQDYLPGQILKWLLVWVMVPAIFFPFAAASNLWGWRLPWRTIVRVVCAWRRWLCVLLMGTVGYVAENYLDRISGHPYVWDVDLAAGLKMLAIDLLETGAWILLLGWLAILFDMDNRGSRQTAETPSP